MLKSIKRISKRTVSIILTIMMILSMMLVGMVTSNAAFSAMQSGSIFYFDNSLTNWSDNNIYFVTGHGSFYRPQKMTRVANTDLWYVTQSHTWTDATYIAVFGDANTWPEASKAYSDIETWANHYTGQYTTASMQFNSGDSYLLTTGGSSNGTTLYAGYQSNGYSSLNSTQTVTAQITTDNGATGTTASSALATLAISTYKMSGTGTSTTSSASSKAVTVSTSAARTASVTLTVSNVDSDYDFVGWYNSSGKVSSETTYTYDASASALTYYARFKSSAYDVTATAMAQTFDVDTGTYKTATTATSSQGTATAYPTSVTPGGSTTLTATAGSGYTFAGWYTNSSCTGTAVSTSATYTPTPTASTDYYALFKQNYTTKTLTVASNSDAVVTVTYNGTTYNEGDTATIPVGATVTVNVTDMATGKYCSSVKAGSVTATASGSSFTFTMPSSDVSVVATIADKESATVTVSSNDDTLGTASATPSTGVYVGDTITLTATATNGSFTNWTITGATYNSGYTSSDATVKVTATGNVTAIANFDEKTYEVKVYSSATATSSSDTLTMKATDEAGVFISTETLANNKHFTIKRLSDNYYAVSTAGSNAYYINSLLSTCGVSKWESSRSGLIYYTNTGSSVYVVYDSNEDEVYLTTDPNNKKTFSVYAKDGTNRNSEGSFTADNTSKYGETRVNDISGEAHTDYYLYSIAEDTAITFTTTLTSTYTTAGFYVGAFCVNGKYVEAIKKSAGVYTSATYTLTSAEAINNKFEITPVYYNSNVDANNDYITFYVDADEVNEEWGGTIAIDAYSYIGGNTGSADHLFGTYPGQPMYLNKNGYYEIKVPKYRYYMSGTSYVKDTNSPVSGVTMTSYHADFIHYNLLEGSMSTPWDTGKNYQTYDFADFVTISQLEDVQTIMFENKWYSQSAKDNSSVAKSSNLGVNPGTLTTVNPWQSFTDYYGRKTDVLGNILSEDQISSSKKLYVISIGNYNTNDSSGTSYATEGQWATMWYVYDESGDFIVKGTPADFVLEDSFAYKAIVNAGYEYAETKISFDREKTSSVTDDSGVRSDGRWYYSRMGLEFTSSVEIEYIDDAGNIVTDTNTNTENTGFIGQTTAGSTATLNGLTEATFTQVDTISSLNCNVANGWQFEGWYIKEAKEDGTVNYISIGDTTAINDFKMSNAYTLVARLSEIPAGSLILTHSQYTGSDPAYHTGTGDYYISAIVKDSNGNIISTVTDSKTAISISNLRADYSIDITLRTVCHGDNTFYAWYEADNGKYFEIAGETEDPRGNSEATYTFTVDAENLFDINGDLATSSLDFYSDIIKVSAFCDITYWYYDRFEVNGTNTMVSYVVRGVELSNEEIENEYKPSDTTIMKYAPEIDTMYVDTKWILTDTSKVDVGKSVATVYATQDDKICKVIAPSNLNTASTPTFMYASAEDVVFNSWYVDAEGNFKLEAPSTIGDYKFTRWEVYKLDEQGNPTSELVTVLSDRIFTLRVMGDYKLVPVYEKTPDRITAHISAPIYNREVYGDSTNPTDRLYVDFLVAFTSTDIPVFKENTTEYTVECGVIVDRNNDLALSTEDREAIIAAATSGTSNPLDISEYKAVFGTNYETITDVAFDSQVVDKDKVLYTDSNGQEHRLTKYVFDNDALTNKNRIDKVLVYTNNEANQNYIFAAYSYVIIRDASGNVVASAITTEADAQFYNLCYTGNKPYNTSTTE